MSVKTNAMAMLASQQKELNKNQQSTQKELDASIGRMQDIIERSEKTAVEQKKQNELLKTVIIGVRDDVKQELKENKEDIKEIKEQNEFNVRRENLRKNTGRVWGGLAAVITLSSVTALIYSPEAGNFVFAASVGSGFGASLYQIVNPIAEIFFIPLNKARFQLSHLSFRLKKCCFSSAEPPTLSPEMQKILGLSEKDESSLPLLAKESGSPTAPISLESEKERKGSDDKPLGSNSGIDESLHMGEPLQPMSAAQALPSPTPTLKSEVTINVKHADSLPELDLEQSESGKASLPGQPEIVQQENAKVLPEGTSESSFGFGTKPSEVSSNEGDRELKDKMERKKSRDTVYKFESSDASRDSGSPNSVQPTLLLSQKPAKDKGTNKRNSVTEGQGVKKEVAPGKRAKLK